MARLAQRRDISPCGPSCPYRSGSHRNCQSILSSRSAAKLTIHNRLDGLETLQSRLNYIAEIVEAVSQWSKDRARPVFALLNEIESDLLVIIGGESKDGREDSTYIMHSSWPANCSAAAMFESLPKRVVSVMNRGVGRVLLMDPEAEKWVVGWGSAMRDLASVFAGSTNLKQSMGRTIALDIMLTNMLSFIASMRLNPMIEK